MLGFGPNVFVRAGLSLCRWRESVTVSLLAFRSWRVSAVAALRFHRVSCLSSLVRVCTVFGCVRVRCLCVRCPVPGVSAVACPSSRMSRPGVEIWECTVRVWDAPYIGTARGRCSDEHP